MAQPAALDDLWASPPSAQSAPSVDASTSTPPPLDSLWQDTKSTSPKPRDNIPQTAGAPKSDFGTALEYGVAHAVPFANDIGSVIQAGETYLPKSMQVDPTGATPDSGTPFWQRVAQQKALINAQDTANQKQYPITSTVAPIGAAIAALPVAGPVDAMGAGVRYVAPNLGRLSVDTIASGLVGGGYGALYGAGTGETLGERAQNAGVNAGLGLVGGAVAPGAAKLIGNIGSGIASHLGLANPETGAIKSLAGSIDPANVMAPSDIANAQAAGQPIVAADVLGPQNVGRVAEKGAVASPQAEAILKGVTEPRFESQGDRTQSFLQNLFGSNLNANDMLEDLTSKAQIANKANYDVAMNSPPAQAVWNPGLENLVQSPDVQQAIGDASKVAQQEAVAERSMALASGQPIPATPIVKNPFVKGADGSLGLATNPDGSQAIPSLRFWDIVKRNLDDQYESSLNSFGKPTNASRLIGNTKNALIANLDAAVPAYAPARAGAKGFFGEQNAFSAGLKYLGKRDALSSSQADASLNALTVPQKQLFAQGVATDMAQKVVNPSVRQNVLRQFNNPTTRAKLQNALGPYSDQVESYMRVENTMDALRTALGNSRTAHRLADTGPYGHGVLGVLSQYLGPTATGAVAGAVGAHETGQNMLYGAGAGAALGWQAKRGAAYNKAVAESIAKLLTENDPQKLANAASIIGKSPRLMNSLRGLDNAIMLTSAGTGARGALPSSSQQSQPMALPVPVARASGGAVKKRMTHEQLVQRLMMLAEKAKQATNKDTKPLLKVPDETVVKALAVAQQAI